MKRLIFLSTACIFLMGCYDDSFFDSSFRLPSFDLKLPMTICHMNEDSSFYQMEIYSTDLATHLSHGDYKLDADYDGYTAIGACAGSQDDCDDNNRLIHPNAIEICGDGIDNNCNGKIDEDCWACDILELSVPEDRAIMDNGCKNRTDPIEWKFEWEACQDAAQYHLFVDRTNAEKPFIDTIIEKAEFEFVLEGYYVIDQNIMNWNWKVRTNTDDIWTPWSATRTFRLEPINSDCP